MVVLTLKFWKVIGIVLLFSSEFKMKQIKNKLMIKTDTALQNVYNF